MVPDFAIFSRELAANAGCVLVRMSPAQQMRSVLAKDKCRAAVQETDFNLMSNSPGEPAYLIYFERWCFSVAACWFCGMRTVSTREKLALCMGFSGREVITLGTFPSIASPCIHGFVVRFELKNAFGVS